VISYAEKADVAASPEKVWAYRLDFANLPLYNPNVSNFARTDGGTEPGPGATYAFEVTIPDMGTLPQTITVVEAEEPSRIVFETGPWYAREVATFEPLPGGGTRVRFDLTASVPEEMDNDEGRAFIEQSGRKQLRLELGLLKEALEG